MPKHVFYSRKKYEKMVFSSPLTDYLSYNVDFQNNFCSLM